MFKLAEYIRTWVTPSKFKTFGWAIPNELKKLDDGEFANAYTVLEMVITMMDREQERRA